MRIIARSVVAVASGLWFASVTPARGEDLQQAWSIALRVNQQLQSQQLQTSAAGYDVASAKSARFPTVSTTNINAILSNSPSIKTNGATGTSGSSTGGSSTSSGVASSFPVLGRNQTDIPISLTQASLPIYTGGKLLRNIDAAGFTLNAQRTEEARTALDLRLMVAEAFVGVLRGRRNLEVARSNVERLGSFARDTRNRREQGLAIRSDELAAEVSLANAQLSEIQTRINLDTAWATYNRYLCRPLSTVVELDEIAVLPPEADWTELAKQAVQANAEFTGMSEAEVADLTAKALKGRPELAGLTAQAKSLNAQAESTLSTIRPQVTVGGGMLFLGVESTAPQGIGFASFQANWTITDSGATRRRAEGIRQRERATLARRGDTASDIALQVRTRWLNLQQARLSVPVARVAVAQSEENINVVNDRYRQQLSTYTEVLDAEARRIQSLTNFYNALYDENLAVFRLRRAVGDL